MLNLLQPLLECRYVLNSWEGSPDMIIKLVIHGLYPEWQKILAIHYSGSILRQESSSHVSIYYFKKNAVC